MAGRTDCANALWLRLMWVASSALLSVQFVGDAFVQLPNFLSSVAAITLSKITLTGHIVVPIQDLQSVRDALVEHIALTRAEDGCLVFNVDEHAEQNGRFDVYEEFVDSASFAAHQSRVRDSDWAAVSVNVSRHYTVVGLD